MLTGTRTLVVERRVERWSREESGTENKSTKPQENRAGRENKSRARAQRREREQEQGKSTDREREQSRARAQTGREVAQGECRVPMRIPADASLGKRGEARLRCVEARGERLGTGRHARLSGAGQLLTSGACGLGDGHARLTDMLSQRLTC